MGWGLLMVWLAVSAEGEPKPPQGLDAESQKQLIWAREQADGLDIYRVAGSWDPVRGKVPSVVWALHDRQCFRVPLETVKGLKRGPIEACYEPTPGDWAPLPVEVLAGSSLSLQSGSDRRLVSEHLFSAGPEGLRYGDKTYDLQMACWASSKSSRVCEDGSKKICDVCQQLRILRGAQIWSSPGPNKIVADFTRTCDDPCPAGLPREDFDRLAALVERTTWVLPEAPGPTLFGTRQACEAEQRNDRLSLPLGGFAPDIRSCEEPEVAESLAEQRSRCEPSRQQCEEGTYCIRPRGLDAHGRCTPPGEVVRQPLRLPLDGPGGARCKAAFGHYAQNAFSMGLVPVASGTPGRALAARAGVVDEIRACDDYLCPDEEGQIVFVLHSDGTVTSYGGVLEPAVGVDEDVEEGDSLGQVAGALQFTVHASRGEQETPGESRPFVLRYQPRAQHRDPEVVTVFRGCSNLPSAMFLPALPSGDH